MNKEQLRKTLRTARANLSAEQQTQASQSLLQNFLDFGFSRLKRVALYLAADGEIDPTPICNHLWKQGSEVFLPRLVDKKMGFSPYRPDSHLRPNKYGIPEPEGQLSFGPNVLDLVLMPLVGFDHQGNRLGMGGGFYDRTFATKSGLAKRRPMLVGLAHECQRMEHIDAEEWDIPLDAAITDLNVYRFK